MEKLNSILETVSLSSLERRKHSTIHLVIHLSIHFCHLSIHPSIQYFSVYHYCLLGNGITARVTQEGPYSHGVYILSHFYFVFPSMQKDTCFSLFFNIRTNATTFKNAEHEQSSRKCKIKSQWEILLSPH